MNNNQKRKAIFEKMKNYKNTLIICGNYDCNIFKNCLVEIGRLNNIINKAIEYIEQNQVQNEYIDRGGFRVKENKYWLEDSDVLLEILKGVDKE